MRWLVLVFVSSVLAAPIQNWSCSSTFKNESCFSYPQDCSTCNAALKVAANETATVYDIFVGTPLSHNTIIVLKITEFNGSRHDIFCSPLQNNASIWMDKRPLTTYEGATVTFVEGVLTPTSTECSVESSVSYDTRNTYHVSTGVFNENDISIEKGVKLERTTVPEKVHGRMQIAKVVDVEDKSSTPQPVVDETTTTTAAPAETTTEAEDTTTTIPVTLSQEDEVFEESNNSTDIAEETGPLQEFVANDTSVSVEDKLSEAAIQKKQLLEAQTRSLDVEEEPLNKTVIQTPVVKSNESDIQPEAKEEKPVTSTKAPESRALDTEDSTTKRPVADQKNTSSTTNEPGDFKADDDISTEEDPDFSTTLSPLASISFALLTTLLLL